MNEDGHFTDCHGGRTHGYWLNVMQAATVLGVSRRTIYYWIRLARIPAKPCLGRTRGLLVNVKAAPYARRQANRAS